MPTRRLLRYLPSLAAVVAFLLCISDAWAQNSTAAPVTAAFPFFGGGEAGVANAVVTAFRYQWQFFGGMSGTNATGGPSALYYLSITATLIGAILIIINKKYQDAVTIGTWFVLVLVMVFAPYNSQLLFYPLATSSGTAGNVGGTSCVSGDSTNGLCGFTPQVVAAHLGSVLSLLIYDTLRNGGGKSLSEQLALQNGLLSDPNLKGDPTLLDRAEQYKKSCDKSGVLPPIVPANLNGSTTTASGGAAPTTDTSEPLSTVYGDINKSMLAAGGTALPDGIAIPKYSAPPAQWGTGTSARWLAYVDGIDALRTAYGVTGSVTGVSNWPNIPTVVDSIITAMRNTSGGTTSGGVFGLQTISSPVAKISGMVTSVADGTTAVDGSDPTSDAREKAFIEGSPEGSRTVWQKITTPGLGDSRYLDTLIKNPAIAGLPVLRTSYDGSGVTCTNTNASAAFAGGDMGAAAAAMPNRTCNGTVKGTAGSAVGCVGVADRLFKDAIAGISKNNAINDDYTPLMTMLTTNGSFKPSGAGATTGSTGATNVWQAADFCKPKDSTQSCSVTATNMAGYLNSSPGNADPLTFAKTLANIIVNNTGQPSPAQMTASGAENNTVNGRGPLSGVKNLLSGTFADMGMAVVGALGYFIGGVFANAVLAIIKVLAQAALMGIIIVTPFVFIMGLLIPSNAAGMLITTTMAVFILKFYPATIAIIDFTIGTISSAVGASSTAFGGFTMTGILLLAEGYMAAKIISLTFFIMFKLGDTNNLRALTSLEDAADKIAEAGVAATVAVAAVGGAALAGGVMTAAGAKGAGAKALSFAKNKALGAADNVTGGAASAMAAPNAAEKGGDVPGEGGPQGPNTPPTDAPDGEGPAGEEEFLEDSMAAADFGAMNDGYSAINPDDALGIDSNGNILGDVVPGSDDEQDQWGLHHGGPDGEGERRPGMAQIMGDDESARNAMDNANFDEMGDYHQGDPDSVPLTSKGGFTTVENPSMMTSEEVTRLQKNTQANVPGANRIADNTSQKITGDVNATGLASATATGSVTSSGANAAAGPTTIADATVNQADAASVASAAGPQIQGAAVESGGAVQPPAAQQSATSTGPVNQSISSANQTIANASGTKLDGTDTDMSSNAAQLQWDQKGFLSKFMRGAISGGWGAIEATGALKSIPGLGQISQVISGIADEGIQAPIRAQAMWRAAQNDGHDGIGLIARWKNKTRTQALGFYRQEESLLANGEHMRQLKENGHQMSGWDNSMDSARQVAARAIADYEGRRRNVKESGDFTTGEYFRNNMLSSMNSGIQVKEANFALKNGAFNMAQYDSNGNVIPGTTMAQGFEAVRMMQTSAGQEVAADTAMKMMNTYGLHDRKMWDRRREMEELEAKVASGVKLEPGDMAFIGPNGKVVTPEIAFLRDELHAMKPEMQRNYREKASIFIEQKIRESKLRAVEASSEAIQTYRDKWTHEVKEAKLDTSKESRQAVADEAKARYEAKQFRISEPGRIIFRAEQVEKATKQLQSLAYAQSINEWDPSITVMANNRRNTVESPLTIMSSKLSSKGFESTRIQQAISNLMQISLNDSNQKLFKTFKSKVTDMNANTISKKALDKYLDQMQDQAAASVLKDALKTSAAAVGKDERAKIPNYGIMKDKDDDNQEYIVLDRAPYDPERSKDD